MQQVIKIVDVTRVTHDVKRFRCTRPEGYAFHPGQATEVAINKPGWENERRPFTFTSLPTDEHLEFTIKIYNDHQGVTSELDRLSPGDELLVDDVWGTIEYKGPGYFIAGGAGITPFLAILRDLHSRQALEDNWLFFANKTAEDIILGDELKGMLKERLIFLTDSGGAGYHHGFIDEPFLTERIMDIERPAYVCGPPGMINAVSGILAAMGAKTEKIIFEK